MGIVVVVPLANDVNDEWSEVGPNFRMRALQAEAMVQTYQLQHETVYVAQAAGICTGFDDKRTLAELGFAYLKEFIRPDDWIVNRTERHVWGTLAEMYYVVANAPADARFVWVSQKRHLPRIRLIARFFLPRGVHERSRYEMSGQTKEIPLFHEFGGYLQLLATKCGLGLHAARLRRVCHGSYDRA
jgi:hypothetical protein